MRLKQATSMIGEIFSWIRTVLSSSNQPQQAHTRAHNVERIPLWQCPSFTSSTDALAAPWRTSSAAALCRHICAVLWLVAESTNTDLLPAPEAFGTVQSVAGARAEDGHPVSADDRVAPFSTEKASGKE